MSNLNGRSPASLIGQSTPGITFWTIFAILMAFGLPILIHSNQGDWKYNYNRSAELAFFYLGLGTLLWITLIVLFYNKFLRKLLRSKRQYENLLTNGKVIKGTIIQQRTLDQLSDGHSKLLNISFKNLVNSVISFNFPIVDTKPELRRYEPGKEINLVVNPDPKYPMISLQNSFVVIDKSLFILINAVLAVLILTPIGLLIYGYLYESRGAGWRYLAFWHPYVISPIMGLIYLLIMIFMQSFIAKPASSDRLLLYGKAVEATIVNSQETGLTVNDLPQIIITVEFLDNNKTIIASFKKLYSILNLSSISVGSKINILYDAQNPNIIEPNE
ncbi:hypothetical protein [Sphingobacterium cellulitidis]|uniref:hypothetical protein n=1 Tax=Sphingobacterium cellulitidis TaxID=1768011 RepID=UPI003C798A58